MPDPQALSLQRIADGLTKVGEGAHPSPLEGLAIALAGDELQYPIGRALSQIADALERIADAFECAEAADSEESIN